MSHSELPYSEEDIYVIKTEDVVIGDTTGTPISGVSGIANLPHKQLQENIEAHDKNASGTAHNIPDESRILTQNNHTEITPIDHPLGSIKKGHLDGSVDMTDIGNLVNGGSAAGFHTHPIGSEGYLRNFPDLMFFGNAENGDFISSGDFSLGGEKHYNDFTLNLGDTLTVDGGWLVIRCQGTCTINGTIDGSGEPGGNTGPGPGGPGGAGCGGGGAGTKGWDANFTGKGGAGGNPGEDGIGGGSKAAGGLATGSVIQQLSWFRGIAGGRGGGKASKAGVGGGTPIVLTTEQQDIIIAMGARPGGAGGGGSAGNYGTSGAAGGGGGGGASYLLIVANELIFGGSNILNFTGGNGGNGNGNNGGGGGGGGVVILASLNGPVGYNVDVSGGVPVEGIALAGYAGFIREFTITI